MQCDNEPPIPDEELAAMLERAQPTCATYLDRERADHRRVVRRLRQTEAENAELKRQLVICGERIHNQAEMLARAAEKVKQ